LGIILLKVEISINAEMKRDLYLNTKFELS